MVLKRHSLNLARNDNGSLAPCDAVIFLEMFTQAYTVKNNCPNWCNWWPKRRDLTLTKTSTYFIFYSLFCCFFFFWIPLDATLLRCVLCITILLIVVIWRWNILSFFVEKFLFINNQIFSLVFIWNEEKTVAVDLRQIPVDDFIHYNSIKNCAAPEKQKYSAAHDRTMTLLYIIKEPNAQVQEELFVTCHQNWVCCDTRTIACVREERMMRMVLAYCH